MKIKFGIKQILLSLLLVGSLYQIVINWNALILFQSTNDCYLPNEEDQQDSYDNNGDVCQGYEGVLRIRSGDPGAAAGTVFFIYMVNHLLYAERYNLLPWVHLDGTSHRIYDNITHGGEEEVFKLFMKTGFIPTKRVPFSEGELMIPLGPSKKITRLKGPISISGNGVWNSYFEPVSRFSPSGILCDKPLYDLDSEQIAPGLHATMTWTVRAWPYGEFEHRQSNITVEDWYRDMRRKAATIVRRYIHPKPWLRKAAQEANPYNDCIAMHVRTTDKTLSGGRIDISMKKYLKVLKQHSSDGTIIYLATDSSQTLHTIKEKWPRSMVKRIRTQKHALRSNSSTPTFDQSSHDRTNREVLTDIYAMAKCSVLVHGRSAVSEAVLYINPDMQSIDLDKNIKRTLGEEMSDGTWWHDSLQ